MEQRIAFIGDVHSCHEELMELLDLVGFYEGKLDKVIFVGDMIDKGPEPRKVLEWAKTWESCCVFIKGNHEEKHLRFHMHERKRHKNPNYRNPMTFSEDQLQTREELLGIQNFDAYRFLDTWKDYYYCLDEGQHLALHGGLLPGVQAEDMPPKILTRVRYLKNEVEMAHIDEITSDMPFWTDRYHGPEKVVFGHQPFPEPLVSSHAVGIDTGCVHGNKLCAYVAPENKFYFAQAKRVYSGLRVSSPGNMNACWRPEEGL